jgi:hypothetical protein
LWDLLSEEPVVCSLIFSSAAAEKENIHITVS